MKKIIFVLLLWWGLATTACVPLAKAPEPAAPRLSAPVAVPVSTLERARQQLADHLRAGRHQAALAFIDQERRDSSSPRLLEKEYFQVLRELSSVGEEFFQAGEYEGSGRALQLLLKHYPKERNAVEVLGISRQSLEYRLELCAERLMAQGLTAYRAGDLSAAIENWKRILVFHGTHDGARRGIGTAEVQLRNLRALP